MEVPGGQGAHVAGEVAPRAEEKEPLGQGVQAEEPSPRPKVPAGQGEQAEALTAPALTEYVPTGQKPSQKAWPARGWYVPMAHSRQEARAAIGV